MKIINRILFSALIIFFISSTHNARATDAWLDLTVIDAQTKEIIPAKVNLYLSDGKRFGSPYHYGSIYTEGTVRLSVPVGEISLEISHGFEYYAIREYLTIPEQGLQKKVALKRMINLRKLGWYNGDLHLHIARREIPVFSSNLPYAVKCARAVGLDYATFDQFWDSTRSYSPAELDQACAKLSNDEFICQWNQEMKGPHYRPTDPRYLYEIPFSHYVPLQGMTNPLIGQDALNLIEFCDPGFVISSTERKRERIMFVAHPTRTWIDEHKEEVIDNLARDLPIDVVTNTVDALEVMERPSDSRAWFTILNLGYRLAGFGTSDAGLDSYWFDLIGNSRTYTYSETFDYDSILHNLKQGRNFATTGPLLLVTVDGQLPGAIFIPDGKSHHINISAYTALLDDYLLKVELIRNGIPIKTFSLDSAPSKEFQQQYMINEKERAWYIVQCTSSLGTALTNPFYFMPTGMNFNQGIQETVATGTVADAKTKKPLSAKIEVTNLSVLTTYRYPVNLKKQTFPDGFFRISTPVTGMWKVTSPGYYPIKRNPLFLDPTILNFVAHIRPEDLENPATYHQAETLVAHPQLQIAMGAPELPELPSIGKDTIVVPAISGKGWNLAASSQEPLPPYAFPPVHWNPQETTNSSPDRPHIMSVEIAREADYTVWIHARKVGKYFVKIDDAEQTADTKMDSTTVAWCKAGVWHLKPGKHQIEVRCDTKQSIYYRFDALLFSIEEKGVLK